MEKYDTLATPQDADQLTEDYTEQVAHELTLRQRLVRRIGAPLAGVAALLVPTTVELAAASPAHADSGLEYPVANTEGGVYSRNSPHTNDTPRAVGQGAYDGDTVRLVCGVTNGDAVDPYDNNSWHKVVNLTRPWQGEFWLSDRYVLSPNKADQLAPGEPNCDQNSTPVQPQETTSDTTPRIDAEECISDTVAAGASSTIENYNRDGTYNRDKLNLNQSSHDTICVRTKFSSPREDGKQFIGNLEGKAPYLGTDYCTDAIRLEVWGDDFYKSSNCSVNEWPINKWLAPGTFVCAAISSVYDYKGFIHQRDAAQAGRSGEIPLGEDNKMRAVVCEEVKG